MPKLTSETSQVDAAELVSGLFKLLVVVQREQDQPDLFLFFTKFHWYATVDPRAFHEVLASVVLVGCARGNGRYTDTYRKAIESLVLKMPAKFLPVPRFADDCLAFSNGVMLDIKSGEATTDIRPEFAPLRLFSVPYDEHADCPSIKANLQRLVNNNPEAVEILRAFFLAAILGINPEKLLILKGAPGGGKSTVGSLFKLLVGDENSATCSLKELETRPFPAQELRGKSLAYFPEPEHKHPDANKTKAIVGRDPVRYEIKNGASGSFVFEGIVVMMTNFDLAISGVIGMQRRSIILQCNDAQFSQEEKAAFRASGGAQALFLSELPGLINWALDMSDEEMYRVLETPSAVLDAANIEAEMSASREANWLMVNVVPDKKGFVPVSDLYAQYKADVSKPLSVIAFGKEIKRITELLGHPVEKGVTRTDQGPKSRRVWQGIRLVSEHDDPGFEVWSADDAQM